MLCNFGESRPNLPDCCCLLKRPPTPPLFSRPLLSFNGLFFFFFFFFFFYATNREGSGGGCSCLLLPPAAGSAPRQTIWGHGERGTLILTHRFHKSFLVRILRIFEKFQAFFCSGACPPGCSGNVLESTSGHSFFKAHFSSGALRQNKVH
jgi:hypothetical protein